MSVVAVLTKEEEISHILPWGAKFAEARESSFVIIHPVHYPQDKAATPISLEQSASVPLLETIRLAASELASPPELLYIQSPDRLTSVLSYLKENEATLLITGRSTLQDEKGTSLRKGLLEHAPCDVILMRAGDKPTTDCKKVMVPVSGGPHATAALQLASQFASQTDTEVKAVYIEQEAGEDAEALGQRILKRVLHEAGAEENKQFTSDVVLADDIQKGIIEATQTEGDVDLLLLGASNLGFVRRTLFGNVPEQFLKDQHSMTIAVMRAYQPLIERTKAFFTRLLERWTPQLSRDERINLFEHLQNGSNASVDFVVLICLSTAIAAFGLLQNSGAVIIGAMLVAPLMTPMLGMGLGLIQGNIVLVKKSVLSISLGFLLSFVIGFAIGLLTPSFHTLTSEMLSRGHPNILDLLVALLSGVAAAYALARPGLLEALPGVAIAAALVPPIATAGASLAMGHTDNAIGAAALFGVNLISIILASAGTLYILGVRAKQKQKRLWARRILIGLALISMLIAFPLGMVLLSRLPSSSTQPLQQAIAGYLKQHPRLSLASLKHREENDKKVLLIRLYTPKIVEREQAQSLKQFVHRTNPKVKIRIISILITPTERR